MTNPYFLFDFDSALRVAHMMKYQINGEFREVLVRRNRVHINICINHNS